MEGTDEEVEEELEEEFRRYKRVGKVERRAEVEVIRKKEV